MSGSTAQVGRQVSLAMQRTDQVTGQELERKRTRGGGPIYKPEGWPHLLSYRYVSQPSVQEQEQLAAIRDNSNKKDEQGTGGLTSNAPGSDIEGGYGGQEGLEDRYATTSGEH